MQADDELYPGEIGEGATAGEGALPCRTLSRDELGRMTDFAMRLVKKVPSPGSPTERVFLFTVSGVLDGWPVKDALYTSEVGERFVAGGFEERELTVDEWLKKYAHLGARK